MELGFDAIEREVIISKLKFFSQKKMSIYSLRIYFQSEQICLWYRDYMPKHTRFSRGNSSTGNVISLRHAPSDELAGLFVTFDTVYRDDCLIEIPI